jgi:AAA domain-containing protein
MNDSYPFGQVFQMRLLALLVQQPQKVLGIIEPQYFTIGNYVEVSRIALEIYAKYLPKKPDFRLDYESLKEAVYATATDSHRRHNFKRLLKDIFRMSPGDSPFLIDQARGFAKVWLYRETLIAAEKDVTNGNYDRVHERFDKLRTSPNGTGDGALTWDNLPRFDPDVVQDTKWLVETLFAEGTLSLIYGPRGAFKSTFVIAACGAVASGQEFLGMKTRKRKVLYLDYENPPDVLKNRVIDLHLGLPENGNLVIWDRFGSQPPPHPGDPRLRQFVRDCIEKFHRRPWIIFDSGSSILRRGEGGETTGQTAPIYTDLRKLCDAGATISILDHTRKYDEEIIYGGQDKEAKADTLHNFIVSKNTIRPERPILSVQSWLKRYAPEGEGRLSVEVQGFKDENGKWHVTGFKPTGDPIVEERKRYRHILRDLIRDNPGSSQRDLAKLAAERDGFSRNKAEAMLKAGIGKRWTVTKGAKGKLVYRVSED